MTNNVEGKKCVLLLEDKLTCNVQMTNNVTANKLVLNLSALCA